MKVPITLKKVVDSSYEISIDTLDKISFDTKVAIVTNTKVSGLHLRYLLERVEAKELYIITLLDGESYKNQKSIDYILEALFNHKFNRNSLLIAFGGGVIGDMTGFAASLYQRGIDFIQIPTTLLSQVDASVGGKTGINNSYGKNLIGAFYQPKAVYIDSYFLKTLPAREFGAGVAEIVKMAVTFNKEFFEFLKENSLKDEKNLQKAIYYSIETKANVVSQDEKEKGIRAALNYGHTFGHVIEKETNYKKYLHGESVAIGMVMANDLAVRLGFLQQEDANTIKNILQRYDLPVTYAIEDIDLFYDSFFLDKKSSDKKLKFIIPKGIGDVVICDTIKKEDIMATLKEFGA